MLKFNLYNITDTETGLKVKVRYSIGMDIHRKMRVWIYEDGYTRNLLKLFHHAVNESDFMSDYHEPSKVSFYESHPYYEEVEKTMARLEKSRHTRRLTRVG